MADIVRLFDSAVTAARDRSKRRGQTGRINASGPVTVTVPGKPGKVYVRLGAGGEDGVIEAWPRAIPLRAHLYVKVYQEDGDWVAEADTGAIAQNGSGGSSSVGPHTHRRHSGLEYIVEPELFAPGVVLPAGGLTVSIGRFRYPNSGNGETYEGGTLDLTSHVPATAGKWRWVLVGVDPDTNAAVAVSGSDFDTQAELTLAEIDNITFTGDIPLAAIQVANGDTALTDHSRYYDAKTWYVPADAIDQGQFLLLAGRSGGQTGYGGTADGDALTLAGSSHANGGNLNLQPDIGIVTIGSANPATSFQLEVHGSAALGQFRRVNGDAVNRAPAVLLTRARGTPGSEADIQVGDQLGKIQARGRVSGSDADYSSLAFIASDTSQGGRWSFTTSSLTGEIMTVLNTSTGGVGIGPNVTAPGAQLHVLQNSSTAAKPVLLLAQNDLSEEMIEFTATVGTGNPVEAVGAKSLTTTHFIRVSITGVGMRYLPVGTIA